MKQKFSFFLAGILLFLSLFLAACSSQKNETPNTQKTTSAQKTDSEKQEELAKGRYREETISFPVPVETIFDAEHTGSSIRILLEQKPGDFSCCKSSDKGISWQQETWNTDWLPENYRVISACFAPEETILVSTGKMSEDPLDKQHATGTYTYFKLKETEHGLQSEQLSLELPKPKEEYLKTGYGLSIITCSEEGNLYGILQYSLGEEIIFQILGFDLTSGALNWQRDTKAAEIKAYGNRIYLNEYDGTLKTLDPASGTDLTEIVSPSGKVFFSRMDMNPEKKKIFYCDETGIYSSSDTMTLTELLVDGKLSSFSDISCYIRYFFHINEKIFLIFLQNSASEEMKLLRYEYDAELATQPEQELTIYSFTNDDAIKKLISDFQSSHPDVFVTYEVGMENSNAKTQSDAINILNTEIMAGNGPDILFLNGLPWKSYQEQNILADLSSLAPCTDNTVFQNLFDAYATGNKQYVVPISFSIPVLAGEKKQIAQVNSLDSLMEMAAQIKDLPPLDATNFLPYIFSTFWQDIQKEDGSISREELKNLLKTVGEFNDLLQPKEEDAWALFSAVNPENDKNPYYTLASSPINVSNIVYQNVAASVGYLGSIWDFADISDHIPGQSLSYRLFPEHVFTSLIAGLNSKSKQPELAKEFLGFALSEEEQDIFVNGSLPVYPQFPVNKKVWDRMVTEPSESDRKNHEEIFQRLGGAFRWPTQAEFEKLKQEVLALNTPAMEDTVILSTILDSGTSYLSGEKSLDAAANEIMQTLELYLAE